MVIPPSNAPHPIAVDKAPPKPWSVPYYSPKTYKWLTEPRSIVRARLLKQQQRYIATFLR